MTSLVPRAPLELPVGNTAVDVELGCADARFIIELAQRFPERLLVGLDIREAFLADGRASVASLGLDNVRLEVCNLLVDIGHLFAPGRIARFFVNFPDPWFKRRQHNRRWLTAEAVDALVRALQPGGEIFVQTDVWAIALESLALLEEHDRLHNVHQQWSFWRGGNPFGVRSTREVLCEQDRLPIWRLRYRRS